MANDRFDKKIKEKLEAVQRPVSQGAWDSIRKRIYVPWYFDFWRKYGLPLYSTLATVLLLVSLKDKFNYENQFRLLNEKISTIEQIKKNTEVHTIVHRDTVYISKTVYVVQQAGLKTQVAQREPELNRKERFEKPASPDEKLMPRAESQTEEKLIAAEPQAGNEIPKEEISESNAAEKDSAATVAALKIPAVTESGKPAKKAFKWPGIDSRLGVNAGLGFNKTIEIGPTFELFFGKSLSFSTGLFIMGRPESEYYDPRDFNMKTRQDFEGLYKGHLPPKYEKIEDIHIKAGQLSVPLNINYYLPLNRKFDMKFLLGTSIDLISYQNVKFESHTDGDEYYSSFDTEQKKGLLHNMSFGAGLQYHFKRYAFQLTPAYIYHFRESDFLSPRSNFRLNGSVLIDLKRR